MTTYTQKSTQLALDASVAVLVMMGTAPGDVEFISLKPRMADADAWAELKARWPCRGLRTVGVVGLCGMSPRLALNEPLEPEQVSALVGAFHSYLNVLICDSFSAQTEAAAEIAELERMYVLPNSRMN